MRTYGDISIRINGTTYQSRGTFEIEPGDFSFEAAGNHDGSVYRTATPSPPKLRMSFERGPFQWDHNLMRLAVDATIRENSNGAQHIVTDGRFTGKPVQNLTTGEVTGLEITFDRRNYQRIGG